MTAPTLTVADVLRRAADAYRTNVIIFGKHFFIDDDGCRCVLGAITYAIDPDFLDDDGNPFFAGPLGKTAAIALAEYLVDVGAPRCTDLDQGFLDPVETAGSWNDEESTTVEEVIAALDAAAARFDLAGGAT